MLQETETVMNAINIRQSRPDDMASIEKLYPAAFPEEDCCRWSGNCSRKTPASSRWWPKPAV
jgi:hypothetical protein